MKEIDLRPFWITEERSERIYSPFIAFSAARAGSRPSYGEHSCVDAENSHMKNGIFEYLDS